MHGKVVSPNSQFVAPNRAVLVNLDPFVNPATSSSFGFFNVQGLGKNIANGLPLFTQEEFGTTLTKEDFKHFSKKTPIEISSFILDFFQQIDEKKSEEEVEKTMINFISYLEKCLICGVEVDVRLMEDLISKTEQTMITKEKPSSKETHPILREEKNNCIFKKYPEMLDFLKERINQLMFYRFTVLDGKLTALQQAATPHQIKDLVNNHVQDQQKLGLN